MATDPKKHFTAQKPRAAANDAGRAEKIAELRRRFPTAMGGTLETIADVTHPPSDAEVPLGVDDRPLVNMHAIIAAQATRREARHDILKIVAKEFPLATWDGRFAIATNRCPELFRS